VSLHRKTYKKHKLSSRDGGAVCRYCGQRQKLRCLTIDHVVPRARGGTNALTNLALACAACNHDKADRLVDDFLTTKAA
jgi:5-methylcytosine-specific restriction endonuclease McrA